MPVYSPEYGPVHSRIFRDPDEEKETKAISIEDTAYWFADSQGGCSVAFNRPCSRARVSRKYSGSHSLALNHLRFKGSDLAAQQARFIRPVSRKE
jgi:hypothetical protein